MRINIFNIWGLKLILQIADRDKNNDLVLFGVDVMIEEMKENGKK
jgi:hypothetical protein